MRPTIIKPKQLWTGKQVFTTILKNIAGDFDSHTKLGMNLVSDAKTRAMYWGELGDSDGQINLVNNELLTGIIDKSSLGDSNYGMIHAFYEIYGSIKAGVLLTAFSRLCTTFLQMHGFTCGLDDMLLTDDYNMKRRYTIEESHKTGVMAGADFCGIQNYSAPSLNYSNRVVYHTKDRLDNKDDRISQILKWTEMAVGSENPLQAKPTLGMKDPIRTHIEKRFVQEGTAIESEFDATVKGEMNNATTNIIKECIPNGLQKVFPKNNLSTMIIAGAKGSPVNQSQIICLLGQQELEGQRVPRMQSGRTLPSFLPYDPNPRSSGFVSDRFVQGIRPQEFFFHCMAGREGLVDTAVKTSRSGYLQRCLIKQLEGLIVAYDNTVRDSDGSVIQFLYGEDSIDPSKMAYLSKYGFIKNNLNAYMKTSNADKILECIDSTKAKEMRKQSRNDMKKHKQSVKAGETTETYKEPDPVLSIYNPTNYFGSISDQLYNDLRSFLKVEDKKKDVSSLIPKALVDKHISSSIYEQLYYMKYFRSLIQPGENVGTIAAQSIGEPSTQMTLNTFHLAGHGGANVTLGIPRLREILMTASESISTPMMILPLKEGHGLNEKQIEAFANKFQKLALAEVVNSAKVSTDIEIRGASSVQRTYEITLEFENMAKIEETFNIDFALIKEKFYSTFIPTLMQQVIGKTKSKGQEEEDDQTVQPESDDFTAGKAPTQGDEDMEVDEDGAPIVKDAPNEDDPDEMDGVDAEKQKGQHAEQEAYEEDASVKSDEHANEEEEEAIDVYKQEKSKTKSKHSHDEGLIDVQGLSEEGKAYYREFKLIMFRPFIKEITTFEEGEINSDSRASLKLKLSLPIEKKKILMLPLVEAVIKKVLLRSVQGITKSFLIVRKLPDGTQEQMIQTSGINFEECYKYGHIVDLNRIESNCLQSMLRYYGIEAARSTIVQEIRNVFKVYGIVVDYRHLSLIGDFMTYNGDIRPFNRIGMQESSSPYLRMSFETTGQFLAQSCINRDTDNNSSPSASLVLGQVVKLGTGMFDLLQDF